MGSIQDYRTSTQSREGLNPGVLDQDPEYWWVKSRTTGPKQLQSLLLNKNPTGIRLSKMLTVFLRIMRGVEKNERSREEYDWFDNPQHQSSSSFPSHAVYFNLNWLKGTVDLIWSAPVIHFCCDTLFGFGLYN